MSVTRSNGWITMGAAGDLLSDLLGDAASVYAYQTIILVNPTVAAVTIELLDEKGTPAMVGNITVAAYDNVVLNGHFKFLEGLEFQAGAGCHIILIEE